MHCREFVENCSKKIQRGVLKFFFKEEKHSNGKITKKSKCSSRGKKNQILGNAIKTINKSFSVPKNVVPVLCRSPFTTIMQNGSFWNIFAIKVVQYSFFRTIPNFLNWQLRSLTRLGWMWNSHPVFLLNWSLL